MKTLFQRWVNFSVNLFILRSLRGKNWWMKSMWICSKGVFLRRYSIKYELSSKLIISRLLNAKLMNLLYQQKAFWRRLSLICWPFELPLPRCCRGNFNWWWWLSKYNYWNWLMKWLMAFFIRFGEVFLRLICRVILRILWFVFWYLLVEWWNLKMES